MRVRARSSKGSLSSIWLHFWETKCLNCMSHPSPPICACSVHTTAWSFFQGWATQYAGPALWSLLLIFLTGLHYSHLITLWLMASLLLIGGLGSGLMHTPTCLGWELKDSADTKHIFHCEAIWRHAVEKEWLGTQGHVFKVHISRSPGVSTIFQTSIEGCIAS